METISALRLNLLRAGYALLAGGLGAYMWPELIAQGPRLELMHGGALSMLCALGLLSVLGLRYPLQMLPLLLFEMAWKAIWLLRIALPLWLQHHLDGDAMSFAFACAMVIVFPFIVPWDYVAHNYLLRRGDPWWGRRAEANR